MLSVVIPVYNEAESLGELHGELSEVAREHGKPVRIGVNSGSIDRALLAAMMDENARRAEPRPERAVRLEAASQLAGTPAALLRPYQQEALATATADAQELVAEIGATPGVTSVVSYWTSGTPPALRSEDGSIGQVIVYAESRDGHEWTFPRLGLYEVNGTRKNNVILAKQPPFCHNFSPFLDARPDAAPAGPAAGLAEPLPVEPDEIEPTPEILEEDDVEEVGRPEGPAGGWDEDEFEATSPGEPVAERAGPGGLGGGETHFFEEDDPESARPPEEDEERGWPDGEPSEEDSDEAVPGEGAEADAGPVDPGPDATPRFGRRRTRRR